MPVRPTFPGVYIEEVPSGVRTVVGVATSVAAFIDYFARGPMNRAIQIFSFADFEREFGGLDALSEASYAIQQFFLNGGTEAYVIRVGHSFATSQIDLLDEAATNSLRLTAGRRIKGVSMDNPGTWGNFVRLDVDYDTTDPNTLFNLTVSEVSPSGTQPVLRTETFRNLTMTASQPNSVVDVVNEGSRIVQIISLGAGRPARTGTQSDKLNSGTLTGIAAPFQFNAQLTGDSIRTVTLTRAPTFPPSTPFSEQPDAILRDARGLLEVALRAASPNDPRYTNATVQLIGRHPNARFLVLTGRVGDTRITMNFTESGGTTAAALGLFGAGVQVNVQQYSLGGPTAGFQINPTLGSNGNLPTDLPNANDIMGVRVNKTGMFALENVDIFNILCIPRAADLVPPLVTPAQLPTVYSAAETYCLERRAFLIMDIPRYIDTVQEMKDFLDSNAGLRSRNAAVYFPRLRIADPLNQFRLRDCAPSGTIAGLYARTDNDRGVWKAPAGIDTTLRNVNELSYVLNDPENGTLNPLGINCLRTFPIIGTISWGARTLDGADVQASEWKYLPVRRFALFLEESLYRGTKFAVFEPNDEPLWAQIRLNIGAFMQQLFRQGAFQGQTPREAYFVKCDKETTTQNDINQGIVNILVGFAPLKPAEFVIIRISQIAGQIQT
jgi:phage tail sheath protein FI